MQALRARLRLLRGPQVPREDAHWSVSLALCAVQFWVFTACVVIPSPILERSRHAPEEPPTCLQAQPLAATASFLFVDWPPPGVSHQRSRVTAAFCCWLPSLSRCSGFVCCSLCPALWLSQSPLCGETTSCSSTHYFWMAELLPLFGSQNCLKPGLDQNHFPEGLCRFPCPPALISHLVSTSCGLSAS